MDPIPDGSTAEQPVQVASLGPVVRMDPIPDGSTSFSAGAAAGEVMRMEPIPNPPVAEPVARPRAPEPVAPAAAPRASAPAAARSAPRRADPGRRPGPPPPTKPIAAMQSGPARGFGLLGTAQASTLPSQAIRPVVARGPAPAAPPATAGGWAVQVGAFANPTQARGAAEAAQDAAGGRTAVQPVASGRATLYRARVTGLSQPAAQAACDRLRRKGACIVLSPDAQG